MEVRRRGFLLGAMAGVCAARGAEAGERPVAIAPPGSEGGARLRMRCTGCNLCVVKCPTKVLKAAALEYGLGGAMMPVMDFSRGFCEKDCTLCGEVCPTGAISRLTREAKAKTKIGVAGLAADWKDRCLARKDGHPCALCESHCGYSAIKVVEEKEGGAKKRKPVVDASKCVGCGACAFCCPAHVIGVSAPPRES